MDVNFMGAFFLTQVVVQSMRQADEAGAIVFVSSIAGLFGIFGYTAYAASKAALVKMAEALHMEVSWFISPFSFSSFWTFEYFYGLCVKAVEGPWHL